MGYRKNPVSAASLLRLAQERFLGHQANIGTALTLAEAQQLFEELEIHQIELELQNEHLNAARAQLEVALNQSSELYDFAPVGILSLDQMGTIVKLNLAGAALLGGERAWLLGSRFGLYVTDAERPAFGALFDRAMTSGDVQDGETSLAQGPLATHVQIRIAPLPQAIGCQVVLVDATERKQIEERLRLSEERWKLALDAAGDGVWDWNVQTGEVVFSRRFEQLFGFSENEYGCRIEDWSLRTHPDDRWRMMTDLQAQLGDETTRYFHEHRGQCKDGSWKWVLSRGTVVSRTPDGKALRVVGTSVDITGRKRTEEALLDASRFQQAVFDSLMAHIAILDRHGTILQTNAAWRKYVADSGYAEAPGFVGDNYLEVFDCMTGGDLETVLAASAGITSVVCGEVPHFQLQHPFFAPLDKRWFLVRVTPVHDVAERVVVSHQEVTRLKEAELANSRLANTDALTGALSRRNFLNLAEQELARSMRYGMPLMVLMLDMDHFKLINDRYGHAVGDAVLQGFVLTVTAVLRESDLVGRIGGEEFAVLLPNTTREGGCALAQRIIESVRANPIEVNGERIAFTVSIGVGCLVAETSFSALLGLADAALYRAKNGGRNRLEVGSA
jgi:diguanylate cyclase (GGDEF)-like protein/PAS domain S-box-containing protein